jgi:predicted Zn-dependent peptidase
VLEEIAQVEDTPDDLVFELHGEWLWNGHPYGRSILGSEETVGAMSSEKLRALHGMRYTGANLVVAGAGNVDHDDFVSRVGELFDGLDTGLRASQAESTPATRSGVERRARTSAQTHIVFGTDVPGHSHPDRYPLVLLSAAMGSGMSSRLFQKVREELGLCYAVYTYQSFYGVSGVSGVYLGTRPGTADKAVSAVRTELERVAATGLTDEELEQIKRQVKGQVMISLESTGSRLHRLASFALYDEELVGLSGLLERIDAVTTEDVRRVASEYFNPERQLELRLGPA